MDRKDQQCGQAEEQRHGDDTPKQLKRADLRAVGEKVVRLRADCKAEENIRQVRAQGKKNKGFEDSRDIP